MGAARPRRLASDADTRRERETLAEEADGLQLRVAKAPTATPDRSFVIPIPALRLARMKDPFLALGRAVDHLMRKPAYSNVRFSGWAKILAGQINRGQYRFVLDKSGDVKGMLGWTLTDRMTAEKWVQGKHIDGFPAAGGTCIVFNVWSADSAAANARVLDAARLAMQGCETLYFQRLYPDGRHRPVVLSVNRFVERHINRQRSVT